MPATAEDVFLLLRQKKYEEVERLIKEDEDLVNAINPKDEFSLFQALVTKQGTAQFNALLRFVLTHPKFNFSYENIGCGVTNLDEMIASVKLELFQAVAHNPHLLFNRNKLTYENAKEKLVRIEHSYRNDVQKDPNSAASNRSKERLERQGEIIALLRDATILHAIRFDDAVLMDRLEQENANPSGRLAVLGDNQLPRDLLKATNKNLTQWFNARFDHSIARIASNPYSFHNVGNEVKRLEAELAAVERQHLEAREKAHNESIKADLAFIDESVAKLG